MYLGVGVYVYIYIFKSRTLVNEEENKEMEHIVLSIDGE